MNNLQYLVFNPFNEKIIQILGTLPTLIGFSIITISL